MAQLNNEPYPTGRFNKLSDAQLERLALLSEELGEAVQAVGKIQRHGYENDNPEGGYFGTNRGALEIELGDVLCAVQMLVDKDDLNKQTILSAKEKKQSIVGKYLHHQDG